MKKIVPFKKEISFDKNISEITSISLEHTLEVTSDNFISGEFIISGEYKIADTSVGIEEFSYNLPFEVSIDDRYIIANVKVDIYDFYYEIVNNNILLINIEIVIDRLEEKPLIEPKVEVELLDMEEALVRDKKVIDGRKEIINEVETIKNSLFDNFEVSDEVYSNYKVYIVKEEDTIETIMEQYNVVKEDISDYNSIESLNVGDRLIIPLKNDEKC